MLPPTPPPMGEPVHVHALSERETQAIRLLALGYSNKQIASRMKVSIKTVETFKARAMEKAELRSRVDIVRFAARQGWLTEAAFGQE